MYQTRLVFPVIICVVSWLVIVQTLGAQAPRVLTLEEAISRALRDHPELSAATLNVSGSELLIRQARARPNPVLDITTENWRFYGAPGFQPGRDLDAFAFVSQTFETGNKRGRRVSLAQGRVRIADLERRALEWRIRQNVRKAYLRALLAEKEADLKDQATSDFQEVIRYHAVRVREGAMAEADLMKVLLEGDRLSLAHASAQLEAERARMELLAAMGEGTASADFRLADIKTIEPTGPPLDLAALLDKSHQTRAEILLAQAGVDEARSRLDLERAAALPDVIGSVGYKRTAGFHTLIAGVSIPLPVFNRNEGQIAYEVNQIERARMLEKLAIRQVDSEVLSAVSTLKRRDAMLRKLRGGMLKQAEESWKIALAAYQEGGFDLSRLLEAQRTLNDIRLLQTENDIEYGLALAGLEAAVGQENLVLGEELLRDDY